MFPPVRDPEFCLRNSLGTMNRVHRRPFQFDFQETEDAGYSKGHDKVNRTGNQKDLKVSEVVAGGRLGHEKKLGNAYYIQHRGVLDINNEFITGGGQDVAHRLRQDYVPHGLRMGHADGVSGFKLAFINGKDASSDDLRHVSSGIDGHDKKTGEECGQVNSVNHGYSIEDYHGLDDHGRTPENFYIGQ